MPLSAPDDTGRSLACGSIAVVLASIFSLSERSGGLHKVRRRQWSLPGAVGLRNCGSCMRKGQENPHPGMSPEPEMTW